MLLLNVVKVFIVGVSLVVLGCQRNSKTETPPTTKVVNSPQNSEDAISSTETPPPVETAPPETDQQIEIPEELTELPDFSAQRRQQQPSNPMLQDFSPFGGRPASSPVLDGGMRFENVVIEED